MRYPRTIFVGILLVIAVPLCLRFLNLLSLYTNATFRSLAEQTVRTAVDREGWLLSDVSLNIEKRGVQLLHRQHMRGTDPIDCYFIAIETAFIDPCDE